MQQPLIFTERRLLPRLMDIFLTVIAWAGFLWLIYDGMVKAIFHRPEMGPRPFVSTMGTLTLYLVVAALYGGVLILWARYNQYRFRVERRTRKPGMGDEEVAESFKITPELVIELNKARVLTVHHNEQGDIRDVEVRLGINDNALPEMTTLYEVPSATEDKTSE
ncbi:poly-beta-1,6-N-acetyl-D-glucosamine biosynthesis protein PgaD [Scandinavium sp. H11S7]|uniref:Poly-beta-1,6-N-acetyl-D-glucosamine biosynthesis protein PgaD n=1 Tax=Scandinavium hiltneri TaxID=2926519 RepID=A0ABT2E7Q2_9ENTR|nr:poly-beta-1,6-N-acetyl-D-glucosamine biosynthesis protein PgaD [Scandinavium hiltneri]MCS2163926.1 poly-beta-1,6-N-acetyl-D-glucosamine biosynthesis protein PgaD [Scandinavium hiltneri]